MSEQARPVYRPTEDEVKREMARLQQRRVDLQNELGDTEAKILMNQGLLNYWSLPEAPPE